MISFVLPGAEAQSWDMGTGVQRVSRNAVLLSCEQKRESLDAALACMMVTKESFIYLTHLPNNPEGPFLRFGIGSTHLWRVQATEMLLD